MSLPAALLATSLKLVASHAYPDGAPPGFTGGFKEDSCHACHFHEDLNRAPGRVAIEGLPAQFKPGERYSLTIVLTRRDMKLAGFQLAARFKDSGRQAGTFTIGEKERVTIERAADVDYVGQTKAGAEIVESGVARWSVEWTAPASAAPVLFHVAANASDGNGSADGDVIYTASAEAAPAAQPIARARLLLRRENQEVLAR